MAGSVSLIEIRQREKYTTYNACSSGTDPEYECGRTVGGKGSLLPSVGGLYVENIREVRTIETGEGAGKHEI